MRLAKVQVWAWLRRRGALARVPAKRALQAGTKMGWSILLRQAMSLSTSCSTGHQALAVRCLLRRELPVCTPGPLQTLQRCTGQNLI